jgi:NTP pyrophosphatase (non-canonical NTP hydrolase)
MNFKKLFIDHVKDSVEAEIADAMIRLFDISYLLNIDLESVVGLTMHNNSLREYLHGKKY